MQLKKHPSENNEKTSNPEKLKTTPSTNTLLTLCQADQWEDVTEYIQAPYFHATALDEIINEGEYEGCNVVWFMGAKQQWELIKFLLNEKYLTPPNIDARRKKGEYSGSNLIYLFAQFSSWNEDALTLFKICLEQDLMTKENLSAVMNDGSFTHGTNAFHFLIPIYHKFDKAEWKKITSMIPTELAWKTREGIKIGGTNQDPSPPSLSKIFEKMAYAEKGMNLVDLFNAKLNIHNSGLTLMRLFAKNHLIKDTVFFDCNKISNSDFEMSKRYPGSFQGPLLNHLLAFIFWFKETSMDEEPELATKKRLQKTLAECIISMYENDTYFPRELSVFLLDNVTRYIDLPSKKALDKNALLDKNTLSNTLLKGENKLVSTLAMYFYLRESDLYSKFCAQIKHVEKTEVVASLLNAIKNLAILKQCVPILTHHETLAFNLQNTIFPPNKLLTDTINNTSEEVIKNYTQTFSKKLATRMNNASPNTTIYIQNALTSVLTDSEIHSVWPIIFNKNFYDSSLPSRDKFLYTFFQKYGNTIFNSDKSMPNEEKLSALLKQVLKYAIKNKQRYQPEFETVGNKKTQNNASLFQQKQKFIQKTSKQANYIQTAINQLR